MKVHVDLLMAQLSLEGPPGIGFKILLRIDWLMARLRFEGPPGIRFEIY